MTGRAPEARGVRYRLWRRYRCPERWLVTFAEDWTIWPVRHWARCLRWRWHLSECRGTVRLSAPTSGHESTRAIHLSWERRRQD